MNLFAVISRQAEEASDNESGGDQKAYSIPESGFDLITPDQKVFLHYCEDPHYGWVLARPQDGMCVYVGDKYSDPILQVVPHPSGNGNAIIVDSQDRKEGTRSRYTQDLLRSSRAISIAQLSGELVNICHECRA